MLPILQFKGLNMAVVVIVVSLFYLTAVDGLQCFNCRGVSYYDPDSCFNPVRGKTVRQECLRGEVCETRLHRGENVDDIIERGCTNACAGRTFVWTEYFQVDCCSENECNAAPTVNKHPFLWWSSLVTILLIVLLR